MASIFTRIIQGEIPCYKIGEIEDCFAFLDINPLAKGHTLVVPKQEVDYLFDVDSQLYGKLMHFAKKVALAIEAEVECERIGLTVIGLEVPHAHIHLIPIQSIYDMNFEKPRVQMTGDQMAALAARIEARVQN